METKNSIRKQKLTLRNQLSPKEQQEKSLQIKNAVLKLPEIIQAEYVLCYAGYQSEVTTTELISALLQMEKKVYLPKVNGMDMDFYRIYHTDELMQGYKGILEPTANNKDTFTIELWEQNIDSSVILMPGAAFSKNGGRIGYGKGFYDRFLAKCLINSRIALAFDLQIAENIPNDAHDIPVTKIVTEQQIYFIS